MKQSRSSCGCGKCVCCLDLTGMRLRRKGISRAILYISASTGSCPPWARARAGPARPGEPRKTIRYLRFESEL